MHTPITTPCSLDILGAMQGSHYFRVTGRVQGVYFRASTRDMAQTLGLRGWVRNRKDGRVEGRVDGHSAALAEFRDWLNQGPSRARVDEVIFVSAPDNEPITGSRFAIRE